MSKENLIEEIEESETELEYTETIALSTAIEVVLYQGWTAKYYTAEEAKNELVAFVRAQWMDQWDVSLEDFSEAKIKAAYKLVKEAFGVNK